MEIYISGHRYMFQGQILTVLRIMIIKFVMEEICTKVKK